MHFTRARRMRTEARAAVRAGVDRGARARAVAGTRTFERNAERASRRGGGCVDRPGEGPHRARLAAGLLAGYGQPAPVSRAMAAARRGHDDRRWPYRDAGTHAGLRVPAARGAGRRHLLRRDTVGPEGSDV